MKKNIFPKIEGALEAITVETTASWWGYDMETTQTDRRPARRRKRTRYAGSHLAGPTYRIERAGDWP